ncbi:MAG: helix-turn-helix transcriptional regulator [Acetatifactor sp.]|nr:helix-turn-helix transcriptional regulator [Acetatifactor sp.]
MQFSAQIKKYRVDMNLSQEELAEKIYVTRQTISNWENDKSYPDIHSLLLLSSLFHVSLDQLIKGDIEIMKREIVDEEIRKMNKYGTIYSILLIATFLSIIPIMIWINVYVIIFAAALYAVTLYYAFKVERIKKNNKIYTYKEITAFMNGKRLDELTSQQEIGKRPYQQFLLAMGSAFIVIIIALVVGFFLH